MSLKKVKVFPLIAVLVLVLLIPAVAFARNIQTSSANFGQHGHYKHVIFFLGDGMGDSEITIARNYFVGANGRLNLDKLPATGSITTYAVQESNPKLPEYVTDSAASGTAWATGVKTSNGRISTTPGTDLDLK